MDSINNLTEYRELIKGKKPVLLDFYADWCSPCMLLLPFIEQLAEKYKNQFNIVKVDIDQNKELAEECGVPSVPALVFVQHGKIKEQILGLYPEAILEQKIQDYWIST